MSRVLLRARVRDGAVEVRSLLRHPMATGRGVDPDGQPVPRRFIREVVFRHGGRVVMRAHWGTGIARNPELRFRFRGARPGDKVSLSWTDNTGASAVEETVVE